MIPLRARVRLSATTGSRDDANSSVTRDGNARGQACMHISAYVWVTNATHALRTAPFRSVYNTWTTPPVAIHLHPYIRSHRCRTHWLLRAQNLAHTERRFGRDLRALTMYRGEKKGKRRWRYLTIHLTLICERKNAKWNANSRGKDDGWTDAAGLNRTFDFVKFVRRNSWLSSTHTRLTLFDVVNDLSTVLCVWRYERVSGDHGKLEVVPTDELSTDIARKNSKRHFSRFARTSELNINNIHTILI